MSVYCDPITECLPSKNWPWHFASHLFGDTVEELQVFAGKLGLKRHWIQDADFFPHYDLTSNKYLLAHIRGAVLLSHKESAMKWLAIIQERQRVCTHQFSSPQDTLNQCYDCGKIL